MHPYRPQNYPQTIINNTIDNKIKWNSNKYYYNYCKLNIIINSNIRTEKTAVTDFTRKGTVKSVVTNRKQRRDDACVNMKYKFNVLLSVFINCCYVNLVMVYIKDRTVMRVTKPWLERRWTGGHLRVRSKEPRCRTAYPLYIAQFPDLLPFLPSFRILIIASADYSDKLL